MKDERTLESTEDVLEVNGEVKGIPLSTLSFGRAELRRRICVKKILHILMR
jgi:hypothetical protein